MRLSGQSLQRGIFICGACRGRASLVFNRSKLVIWTNRKPWVLNFWFVPQWALPQIRKLEIKSHNFDILKEDPINVYTVIHSTINQLLVCFADAKCYSQYTEIYIKNSNLKMVISKFPGFVKVQILSTYKHYINKTNFHGLNQVEIAIYGNSCRLSPFTMKKPETWVGSSLLPHAQVIFNQSASTE